jgi:hypothetical protein
MKKLFTFLVLAITIIASAQAPQGFNYQATVRNSAGQLLLNQNVLVKFSILQNSASGAIVYSENQTATTDDLGHINLVVGQGTSITGSFSSINWASGTYFLGIELNTGAGYVAMGTNQLMSVPYALNAGNSCSLCLPTTANIGDVLTWNGSAWIATPAGIINSPSVSTILASNVTPNSAISGGTITSDGGNTILAKGVCWSSNMNPTTNDFHTIDGSGANNFTSTILNLTPGSNYYYRAYITNSIGTYYGSTYVLSTPPTLPTVSTNPVTNITYNTAISGGNVTNDGGASITARGVCWCTCPTPTINDSHTTDGSGLGAFSSILNNLGSNFDIYVRAYATNSQGTSYGETIYFISAAQIPFVGSWLQGGIVAYVLQQGDPGYIAGQTHGIIVAPTDQNTAQWGCLGIDINGADSVLIGAGQQNTTDILNGCSTSSIAAKICDDLILGGYSDWYLPSKDELNKVYLNRNVIGGFVPSVYWTSSENNTSFVWTQYFNNGYQGSILKNETHNVRPIRKF